MTRDEVFISYSHKDKEWLDELICTLEPLTRTNKIKIWADTKITIGSKWKEEISGALARARIAILLVSRSFLASDFITLHELPPLLRQPGLVVFWIAVGPCLYEETEIAEYQPANDPSRPLNSLSAAERDQALVDIARKIKGVLSSGETEPRKDSPNVSAADGEAVVSNSSPCRSGSDRSTLAIERMRRELAEGKWHWRSIDALAAKAAISSEEALDLLRKEHDIELGKLHSGEAGARLLTRRF